MGAPTGLLATMALTLLCSCAPVHGRAERCSGFRHLENGRTFFRYGGLLVIFRCDPGYKLHGYRTNSCVSGHWSRELPACVGSACPSPGPLVHGTSSVNEDVSWAMFSCDSGFKLQGPSMLYCKGHAWNGTKPVCKESDMMSSASRPAVQKPHMQQNRHNAQAPVGVNHQRHSLYDTLLNTASKEAYLKLGLPSNVPSQTPNSEGSKMSSRELPLKEWVQYPEAEIPLKEVHRLLHPGVHIQRDTGAEEGSVKPSSVLPHGGTVKNDLVAEHSSDDMEKVNRGTESFPMPLTPATQVTTESEPSPTVSPAPPPRILTSAPIAVTNGASERGPAADTVASVQTQASTSVHLVLSGENVSVLQSQAHVSPPVLVTGSPANEDAVNYPFLDERSTQAGSRVDSGQKLLLGTTRPLDLIQSTTEPLIKHQPDRMQQTQGPYTGSRTPSSSHTASISPQTFTSSSPLTPSLSPAYSAPTALSSTSFFTAIGRTSTRSNAKVTPPSQTTSDLRPPHQIEHPNLGTNVSVNALTLLLSRGRRPVCPYPPVPAHGTFYFRNVVNPAPTEYKHYIQYACYPGYTLANGDIHSYCHQGGAWSGVTPVCLELTPCSVNNGGCSQICLHSWNHNDSETSTRCHCRPGFTLLEDKRTCRDLDECVEGQHQCHQKCVNTFGSFKCSCDEGYELALDHTSCTDVDECLLPAVTGCVFGCVNTPGSFYCQCPAGYSLNTTDGHCQDIDECAVKEGAGPCEEFCHNSPGSYSCSCSYGYSLAGDGHGCLPQCSPGYRKQGLVSRLHNSTTHRSREECVDIDECKEMELQVNKCEWQCVNLPGSHRCICPKGYSLQADGAHCKDINECNRKNGGCSHLCLNYRGGYKCACPASHRLSPYSRKKCLLRKTEDAAG